MVSKVLLVDDEPAQVARLGEEMVAVGHHVDRAGTLEDARTYLALHTYDLIILDRELKTPSGTDDGLTLCAEIRASGISARIIFYTNLVSPTDHRLGWSAGADDYMEKGWPLEVTLARCEAHLARPIFPAQDKQSAKVYNHAGIAEGRQLVVDETSLVVSRKEDFELAKHGGLIKPKLDHDRREHYKKVKMTDLDLAVFFHLYRQPDSWVTEQDLLRDVWGYSQARIDSMMENPDLNSGLVHTTISRMRRKIDTRLERKKDRSVSVPSARPWAFISTSNDEGQTSVSYKFNGTDSIVNAIESPDFLDSL